jgi:hypothetical protein
MSTVTETTVASTNTAAAVTVAAVTVPRLQTRWQTSSGKSGAGAGVGAGAGAGAGAGVEGGNVSSIIENDIPEEHLIAHETFLDMAKQCIKDDPTLSIDPELINPQFGTDVSMILSCCHCLGCCHLIVPYPSSFRLQNILEKAEMAHYPSIVR